MRLVCYAARTTLATYVKRRNDQQVVFGIGGQNCMLATELVASHDGLYFHLETQGGEILSAIVDTYHREEFGHCPVRELPETIAPPLRQTRWIGSDSGQIWAEDLPDTWRGL